MYIKLNEETGMYDASEKGITRSAENFERAICDAFLATHKPTRKLSVSETTAWVERI